MNEKISVSVVIPVYSGELYLQSLHDELLKLKKKWNSKTSYLNLLEVIYVNDNAIDNSSVILGKISSEYNWVNVLTLSRNYGQHAATVAGILHTSGDWIVTMDEDLQHRPEHIEEMLYKIITDKADIVYANPTDHVHQSVFRDFTSRIFKKTVSIISRNDAVPFFNSFRLIRGPIARASASVTTHDSFYDVILGWYSDRFSVVKLMLKDERFITTNKSGYSLKKLLSHSRKMLITSDAKILRLGTFAGIIAIAASIIYGLIVFTRTLIDPGVYQVRGWASTIVIIIFIGGLLASLIGITLEYLSVILRHIQGKPAFFVIDRSKDSILAKHFKKR